MPSGVFFSDEADFFSSFHATKAHKRNESKRIQTKRYFAHFTLLCAIIMVVS